MIERPPDHSRQDTHPDNAQKDDFAPRSYPVVEQIAHQRKIWKCERVGFFMLLAFVSMSLAGLFSSGPLSTQRSTSPEQRLTVEYERFLRNGASSRITLTVQARASAQVTLSIGRALLENCNIEGLQPHSLVARSHQGGLEITGQADTQGRLRIYLKIRPDNSGLVWNTLWFEDDKVSFTQFIYP
ncbi:hypothetical protein [Azomonas macrocytogenes]|uniref:Uncharacterized protein n=1 Tax=Azomonas macrocytogenes TaxID=69962 RepID=A0A839SZV1_AZOMA|nr:hypothetical protein [Azomonas macrocytogenes]MBB3101724.1 hypothetical protein [Azomonas macrocytogenes]